MKSFNEFVNEAVVGKDELVFKNKHWKKRDYEATNKVAVVAKKNPDPKNWVEADASVLKGLEKLYKETANGVTATYYGYL